MNKIIIILFLLTVFFLGFLAVKDTDFGWHYRCGNQFLTSGKLCLKNDFSYYLSGYKAYYSGHLYDILLAFFYNHGGFLAISITGSAVFVLSAVLFYFLIQPASSATLGSFLLVFFLSYSVFNLGLRPQIISFFFFLSILLILSRRNIKFHLFLPFLFVIWVNMHIGFFIGLIVFLFYLIDVYLYHGRGKDKPYVLLIFTLSIVATFLNPFGINVYKEILNHAFTPLNTMIAEWVSPAPLQMLLIIFLGIIAVAVMVKNKSFSLYYFLLLSFFGIISLQARRNVPFFYTVFFYVFLNNVKIQLDNFRLVLLPILSSILLLLFIIWIPQIIRYDTDWQEYCDKPATMPFPCEALKKYPQLSGNVYASYEWGGFLIWQKPDIKVFVDGRMSAWRDSEGKYPYQKYLEILQTKNDWNGQLRKLKTDYILIASGTFLDLLLQKDAVKYQWIETYRDATTVIYKTI